MSLKHLVSSSDLTKADCEEMIRRFNYFSEHGISPELARGKILATLFFQPSTRTMCTFQVGMLRMGGGWIGVTGEEGLALAKGESFEDTINEFSCFADLILLRHPDDDAAERAAQHSFVPVLNGGSGSREHAIGAPWLLLSLLQFIKRPLQGLKIGIYGTPEINRATKAFVPILGYFGIELFIDDLGHFPLPKEVEEHAMANGMKSIRYDKLDNFIGEVDALLMTRGLQKGIIPADKFPKEKEEMILKTYKPITKEDMKKMRSDAVLYMIKPRTFEIETEVDDDPRASYSKLERYDLIGASILSYYLGIDVGE